MVIDMKSIPQQPVPSASEFSAGCEFMNDGKSISVKIIGTFKNDCRSMILAVSSLGVCRDHDSYREACSAWLYHYNITSIWFALNNLELMRVETDLGDVITEFMRH